VQWQTVTCNPCGRTYQCTPWDDYYPNSNGGCCESCLLGGRKIDVTIVETDDGAIIVQNLENNRG
jgi:hypothetical protein